MVPLPSLAEIPQLQALQSQVRRLWAAQTVLSAGSRQITKHPVEGWWCLDCIDTIRS